MLYPWLGVVNGFIISSFSDLAFLFVCFFNAGYLVKLLMGWLAYV